jgi:hypothetical protein
LAICLIEFFGKSFLRCLERQLTQVFPGQKHGFSSCRAFSRDVASAFALGSGLCLVQHVEWNANVLNVRINKRFLADVAAMRARAGAAIHDAIRQHGVQTGYRPWDRI